MIVWTTIIGKHLISIEVFGDHWFLVRNREVELNETGKGIDIFVNFKHKVKFSQES